MYEFRLSSSIESVHIETTSQTLLSAKGQQRRPSLTPGQSHMSANPVSKESGSPNLSVSSETSSDTVVMVENTTLCGGTMTDQNQPSTSQLAMYNYIGLITGKFLVYMQIHIIRKQCK